MTEIKTTLFGTTSFGKEVHKINIKNSKGMEADFLTYGAIIKDILVPDKGKLINVVLGYKDLESYEKGTCFLGSFVGRYANRIGNSSFDLDGKHWTIPANEGKNHLHGSFCKKVFSYGFEGDSLIFSYTSPDMEEGFPGNLTVKITYTLTEENELKINYQAQTDKPTVINFTNHSYFNLNGDSSTILNHSLFLDSDYYTPTDSHSIPTGELFSVSGTPMDFRKEKKIGADINRNYQALIQGNGYDHNYVLKTQGKVKKIATLKSDKNNITMECFTDQPGVQLYSGNYLNTDKGAIFQKNAAICLETQHYPDSPNKHNFPSTVLLPEMKFESTTIYRFLNNYN